MTAAFATGTMLEAWSAAVLAVSGARVAVPAGLVDQAIETPHALGPALPGEPAMLGTFLHVGQPCPLVDLGVCLGRPVPPEGHRRTAVLLRMAGKRIAVAVDGVESVRSLPAVSLTRLSTSSTARAFALATIANHAEPIIVLEERDLLSMTGMVFAEAASAAVAPSRGGAMPRSSGRTFLSFSRAGVVYGIDVRQVAEIVSDAEPVVTTLHMPGVLGLITTSRGKVMLLDHPAPGCGEPMGCSAPRHVIVLEVQGLRFAVPVDAIHALTKPDACEIFPLPAGAGAAGRLVLGLAPSPVDAGSQILIDAAAVLAAPGVRSLVEQQTRSERRVMEGAVGPSRPFIELQAGGTFFARLEEVCELAELPRASIVLTRARPEVDGYARHRGQSIAVIDLVTRLGTSATEDGIAKLAIVSTDGGKVGFLVDGFTSIQHLHIAGTPGSAVNGVRKGRHASAPYGRHWHLLHATSRQETRIIAVLDLLSIAREAQGGEGPERAPG